MSENILKHIAYCTDFSENANVAFDLAKDLAWRYGATLHIVHIVVGLTLVPDQEICVPIELVPEDSRVKIMESATEAAGERIEELYLSRLKEKQHREIHIVPGYPATEIIKLAKEKDFDLIVMGSHGLTGLAHVIFGSTTDRVMRKAPCSVLTVRQKKKDE